MIDKANGGKADALNAGINHANYPLFCAIDADTMLDAGALSRLVWEFQAAPETVAVGGIVRIVNGSTFEDGQLATVRTPRNLLANLQIVEYLRAFLGGRIGWSVRLRAWWTIARRKGGWGEMTRKGFGPVLGDAPAAVVPGAVPAVQPLD